MRVSTEPILNKKFKYQESYLNEGYKISLDKLKYLWSSTIYDSQKNQIIEAACKTGDFETLKYFWGATIYDSHKNQIIEAACKTGDFETLKYFLSVAIYDKHKNMLIDSMLNFQSNEKSTKISRVIKENNIHNTSNKFDYDIFICYATEDKESCVKPLVNKLSKRVKLWYDDFELKLGDSLRRKIDQGLAHSHYGVVIFSKNFFKKEWPQKELDALIDRERNGEKVILPILHNITHNEMSKYSPILSSKIYVSTSEGMDIVVKKIMDVLN